MSFIIALAFEALALVWIVFMVREEVARKQELKIEMKIRGMQKKAGGEASSNIKLRSDTLAEDEHVHPLKLLFDLENLKSIIRTVVKKRPNKARKQLFLLFISVVIMSMVFNGKEMIRH